MRLLPLALALLASLAARADPVLTYHGALDRSGRYTVPGLTYERARGPRLDPAFHVALDGEVYAQPLLWRDQLIVATETNEVLALDAHSGAQIWRRSLGDPVPASALPCGNVSPLGVTGAPVIDEKRGALYLDAAVMRPKGPQHEIFALALADGSDEPGWPVAVAGAVAGFDPATQNQRGALALFDGKVFVPFSGHWGDCGDYHGYVVAVSPDDPHSVASFATRARGGGIWAQGGVSGDGASLFAVTGNTFGAKDWGDGEAVLRLSPDLRRPTDARDYFAPSNWRDLDRNDLDLGGTAAVPLDVPGARKLLLAVGKDGNAYLLDRADLGGVGGALASARVASNVAIASPAVQNLADGALVILQGRGAQCPRGAAGAGLIALKISVDPAPAISTAWCAALEHAGSPILTTTEDGSNAIVWALGAEGDDKLHAFRADDGTPIPTATNLLRGLHHLQTLIASGDRLYVAADGAVYAFRF